MIDKLFQYPHRRYNPLTGDWILVSPHRLQRPWQGKIESLSGRDRPSFDPGCYLCPGNNRADGKKNPKYKNTFVFENDFAALLPHIKELQYFGKNGILQAKAERGICRVICFSPRHDLTFSEMAEKDISKVLNLWIEQYADLGEKRFIGYVQIFENKGKIMGCSNPHPHGQIWATESVPREPAKEDYQQREYFKRNRRCLLCDYIMIEKKEKTRVVCENESWMVVVPFWAVWPFETMVLSKRHIRNFLEIGSREKEDLINVLKKITTLYDNLFQISFPYTMGFHQTPTDNNHYSYWHVHAHFYPPLLRSATIQKFMVGFEMLGTAQRDFTAEYAAERLRSLPEIHYRSIPE